MSALASKPGSEVGLGRSDAVQKLALAGVWLSPSPG